MNLVELSDLEEGEILEYESVSPCDFKSDHRGVRPFDSPIESNKKSVKEEKHGGINERQKSNVITVDLESISSDGEVKSDVEKYPSRKVRNYEYKNGRRKLKSRGTYGTVEDIMSEIGETISRCRHKRGKSKEFDRHMDISYDAWHRKIFSNHLKEKKRKRKLSFSDSGSEVEKIRAEKRKKRKRKKESHHEEESKPKMRDFDEVRRNLLEKLKKQREEEESKAKMSEESGEAKVESTEIQEVDMLIDCTNYVDKVEEEKEKEEELDLIQLRLIALTSNKKQKIAAQKTEEKQFETNKNSDLDRNELLLRAEALKTALLKKHEKRLNRLKGKKQNEVGSSGSDTWPPKKEALDACPWKENIEKNEGVKAVEKSVPLGFEMKVSTPVSTIQRKPSVRVRGKRKKKKSGTFANNLKENTEKSETIEEDDRTLRSQLLNDLMKKKSLKNMEKKSVLMNAIQLSANKPPVIEAPKEITKGFQGPEKTLINKVSAVKPAVTPKIPKPEIQRIIVHLGSEDSSDEEDVVQTSRLTENEKNKPTGNLVQADYERSVELLLSEARRKIEGEKKNASKNYFATPEAVYKHLPPSQRLEYIRLKQKIAERERLKKQKSENANVSGPQPADASKPPTPVNSSATQTRPNANQGLAVNRVKNGPVALRGPKPPSLLLPSSQALISKLKLLLKKIKIEKTIEENYVKEMAKLKAQLSLLERKKTEQRFKIRKLGEESMKTYKAIQVITARSMEEKKKDDKEVKKPEEDNKSEVEGKNVSNEPEAEISKADTKTEAEVKDVPVAIEEPSVVSSLEYYSPFVTSGQVSNKVDPNVMLCQFDLTGVCKDEECGYQHLRTS